jgi:hypothetical protein
MQHRHLIIIFECFITTTVIFVSLLRLQLSAAKQTLLCN